MTTLSERIKPLVNSGFAGLWVVTSDREEAQKEIQVLCKKEGWVCVRWDIAGGVEFPLRGERVPDYQDPRRVLRMWGDEKNPAMVSLHNFHRFLKDSTVLQSMSNALQNAKEINQSFVVLSHGTEIPLELERQFTVVDHPLPTVEELQDLATKVLQVTEDQVELGATDAAKGLTRQEAEEAFALSLYEHKKILREVVASQKAQIVRKKGFLELHQGGEDFNSLGGLTGLKTFCSRALNSKKKVLPRGILLLGVSGTGKSQFCKCLGAETGRPILMLDFGRLHSKYVGDSEANIRQALATADAMSPCILFGDEIEKALSGVGSDGDSGVSARIFGTFLTWLNDHTSDVFFAASANDISRLPPEFSRAERFDGVFFIDLPTETEREGIWKIHRKAYEVPENNLSLPSDEGWTGAEIRSCCRLSALLDCTLADAANHIVPVSRSAGEKVNSLREWASFRALDAATGKVFAHNTEKTSRRAVRN